MMKLLRWNLDLIEKVSKTLLSAFICFLLAVFTFSFFDKTNEN